ncbi:efflux RND transporter permease subunit [Tenacibaculum finnmarkense]|uniref:efflux RND transporter permease subunit n=1 Tax=Tenacibaculum finnmarkense TaxID=2781243 RepID=UPI001E35906C|nr:efflux RND transporter permease subunit [Tenacibaculum finnmarkense]MCD8410626.1 efflux RND transporter permease subunit [Tenacibaculum finnmarkense genomovar ulcerans]
MNITKFSINKSRVVLSILVVCLLMGLKFYSDLSRDSMPPFTIRVASIISSFPGASPERVEQLVTDKIEKIVQELPELKKVTSTSRSGLSVINVELKMDVSPEELQSVWNRLRRKLTNLQGLPQNVRPLLKDEGIGEVFGIALGIANDGFSYKELKTYADALRNDLIKLDDAAKVEINGNQEERVFVNFDNNKLKTYGLTSSTLQGIIATTNILNTGGEINIEEERIILEPTGNFNTLSDIENLLIPIGKSGQVISLKDITTIKQDYIYPPKQVVKVNGNEAITLHISLKKGRNIIKLGQEVDALIQQYNAKFPVGLNTSRITSIDTYIDTKIDNFMTNLLQAIGIVLAVMLIFLGLRTGLVISSLIPIVTISTLFIMGLMGIGLNQISLAALIMALGMMVDNGIVVAESIIVKMESGKPAKQSAIESGSELFMPLLISTLTTSAAFMSFYMAESVMGDIMGPIFVVITIALISSWIISLSIITLFAVYFLKVEKKEAQKSSFLDKIIYAMKSKYKDLILIALQWKKTVLFSVLGLLILSFFGFGLLDVLFFPDSDRNMITIDINLPQGTKIEETSKTVFEIEKYIKTDLLIHKNRLEGVQDWTSFIGKGPSSYDLGYSADEPNSNYAHMLINTTHFLANANLISKLDTYCFNNFPNAQIKVGLLGAGGGGTPIEIKVSGDNPDKLASISSQIKAKLFSISGTKNIRDDWGPKGKKFIIKIAPFKAQKAGISNQDIAISLQTVLDGFNAGEFREGNNAIPIVMQSANSKSQDLASLETLNIYGQNSGKSVPLIQVAEIIPQWQYTKIKRLDLTRSINVKSELTANGNANKITAKLKPWLVLQKKKWGNDYTYKLGGDAENSAENMGAVIKYLPLSAFIIIMLLIIQFNSLRKMTMIVLTIPLGVIGMVLGLLIFNVPFGFMAFLGVISLAGIVINNAIVLVDRIEIEEHEIKRIPQDAIIAACLQRFRPIILATFTTVLGLVPLYLGGGAMWEPMAVTIMVGLLFGTVITLLFIPVFYSVLYKVNYKGYQFKKELLD